MVGRGVAAQEPRHALERRAHEAEAAPRRRVAGDERGALEVPEAGAELARERPARAAVEVDGDARRRRVQALDEARDLGRRAVGEHDVAEADGKLVPHGQRSLPDGAGVRTLVVMHDETFDCVVVGGGAAGLSAALVLGRARRTVLLLDDARQSNLPAHGVGGLLGHDGTPPAELYALARRQLEPYASVVVRHATAERAEADGDAFRLTLAGGETVAARRLLLATGMDYATPAVEGVRELWGDTVFHCPFCHGWEVRDRPLAVLGGTPHSAFAATLLTGWSADVVLLADGPPAFDDEAAAGLASAGVRVDERRVERLEAEGGRLRAVRFADGSALEREGLMVQAPLRPRTALAEQLGLELTDTGAAKTDPRGATSLPGVFAAGDGAGQMAQVAQAAAGGALAGAMIAHELITGPHGVHPPAPAPAAVAAGAAGGSLSPAGAG